MTSYGLSLDWPAVVAVVATCVCIVLVSIVVGVCLLAWLLTPRRKP